MASKGRSKKIDPFAAEDDEQVDDETVADDEETETPAEEEEGAPAEAPAEEEVQLPEGQTNEPAAEGDPLGVRLVPGGNPGAEPTPADAVSYEGEHLPPLTGETWVKLKSDTEDVPVRFWGAIGAVIDPIPVATATDEETGATYQYTPNDAKLTVRERSQGAYLVVPLSAVDYMSLSGRLGVNAVA